MRRNEREISDFSEIESIISRADVCRIAFADGNIPYIVTMNFGYRSGVKPSIYFHCANEGRKLNMIRKNNYVCFEIDTDLELNKGIRACDWGMKYSSIVGYGNIIIITDEHRKKEGFDIIMKHYNGTGSFNYDSDILRRTTVLQLLITEMSGKKS
jgi:nitroimidazol reductase NimA-like FMN-containing flavoprotein (pyridoxamine 5'-phosphate oxidase superfamily)